MAGAGRKQRRGPIGYEIGCFLMFLTYVCVSFLSWIREYYADRHSTAIVENCAQKLQ